MAQFTVNGKTDTVEKNQKLMRYLRDELRLLSVKDGCAEGACGACTIIIDGKTQRACIPMTDKMEGKSVLTVEGLSDFEKQVFTYAFGEAGSVQCGFCIPGMVMCAKALIERGEQHAIAAALKKKDWQVKHYPAWAGMFDRRELSDAIVSARDAERAMKSGTDPHQAFLDWLVAFVTR